MKLYCNLTGGGETEQENFLPSFHNAIMAVLDDIEPVSTSAIDDVESESTGENRELSLLGLTIIFMRTAFVVTHGATKITDIHKRDIDTAMQATHQIFDKLHLGKHVYHDLVNRVLHSLQTTLYSTADISSKTSAESSMHGVLHNLTIKLVDNMFGLLDLLDKYPDSVDSELNPLLESLNCTLGSLNRALDPLPGGKYAMEGELYNLHLTPHRLPIIPTRLSEPTISYCCSGYRQLTIR
ncbi:hypothetical protein [Anaplasma bovis]|uniref:hypothetical protein n=1 Tax=Anaplasma bovis TaxID=186733 RepID=UPI002FEF84F3